ncbi:MAG: hypothetical protein SF162_12465 [bacterium]|nr:hypothetical protein [bacterium]
MNALIRPGAVVIFAVLDILSSFWLGSSLDQGSDPTPVYFLPFGLTFAIWGLIFSSQLVYAVYQALPSQRDRAIHRRIGGWVALNAALTALWNFTAGSAGQQNSPDFQPLFVVATVFILVGMLFALTQVFIAFREMHADLTPRDRALVQFPLTVFFAWLNVAMIANTTAGLDAVGFTGEPNGAIWAAVMLVIAAVVASLMIFYTRPGIGTFTYTGVIIWAVVGIFFNNFERSTLVAGVSVLVTGIVIMAAWLHLSGRTPFVRPGRTVRA